MILITLNEWLGKKRTYRGHIEPKITLVTLYSKFPMNKALNILQKYQDLYNERSCSYALEYTLISYQFTPSDTINDNNLDYFNVECIEEMYNNFKGEIE